MYLDENVFDVDIKLTTHTEFFVEVVKGELFLIAIDCHHSLRLIRAQRKTEVAMVTKLVNLLCLSVTTYIHLEGMTGLLHICLNTCS